MQLPLKKKKTTRESISFFHITQQFSASEFVTLQQTPQIRQKSEARIEHKCYANYQWIINSNTMFRGL